MTYRAIGNTLHRVVAAKHARRIRTSAPALAELIRSRRSQLGLTQAFVAEQIGVDQSTLARWERGDRVPSGLLLLRLSSYLRFTDAELDAATKKSA